MLFESIYWLFCFHIICRCYHLFVCYFLYTNRLFILIILWNSSSSTHFQEFWICHLQQCTNLKEVSLRLFRESGIVIAQFFLYTGPGVLQHRAKLNLELFVTTPLIFSEVTAVRFQAGNALCMFIRKAVKPVLLFIYGPAHYNIKLILKNISNSANGIFKISNDPDNRHISILCTHVWIMRHLRLDPVIRNTALNGYFPYQVFNFCHESCTGLDGWLIFLW